MNKRVESMKKQVENGPDKLRMWACLESTVNRGGDKYMDQMERNGHATRLEDIARYAGLGIKKSVIPYFGSALLLRGWRRPTGHEKTKGWNICKSSGFSVL